jgi:hypothetical protein
LETRGNIAELRGRGAATNLVAVGGTLNEYLYLVGDDPSTVQRSGPARISVRDRGPLVASLMAEADAPGCHTLAREVRLVAGGDYVECVEWWKEG